ncbi:MAG TPA: hypothetical protein VMN99_09370 [Anaerolineales bacterium]|nr:hypothetical protein [Anaerolineales bacterium]
MVTFPTMAAQTRRLNLLRFNLALTFMEGVWVLWFFLRSPSETDSVVFLQYSLFRLFLLSFVLLLLLGVLYSLAGLFRSDRQYWGVGKWLITLFDKTGTFWTLLIGGGVIYALVFVSDRLLVDLASYRERVLPLLVWFGISSLHWLVSWLYLRWEGSGLLPVHRAALPPAGIILGLLFLLIVFIASTRIGLTPDPIYWQNPGSPILISQVLIALLAGLLFKALIDRFSLGNERRFDTLVCITLWAAACFLWLGQPARISYNSLQPGYPNFQTYPFGDSLIFDSTAHNFLAGEPIPGDFWFKPLYTLFLAVLHIFSGENYDRMVFFQIVILACIPVMVYLIGWLIGNRTAGFVAGFLIVIRERNEIALSNIIQVSHLKILLSDVFSMGLVVLLTWVILRWLQKPSERRLEPLVIGGVLGLLVLTRGHAILLIPIVLGIIIAAMLFKKSAGLQPALLFAFGAALTLFPWFLRNYERSGTFSLQDPASTYTSQMAGIYSLTPSLQLQAESLTRTSSETDLVYYDRLRQQVVDFVIQHPDEVLRFVSAHYFHNVIYSYIYLPQSFRIESLRAYVTTEPFWGPWQGGLSTQSWILLLLNMALIALGIGTAWRKNPYLALIPLVIGMGYNASVSVGRISGWRFILPADWITLIYYSLGLVQVIQLMSFLVSRTAEAEPSADEPPSPRTVIPQPIRITGFAVLFLLIGMAVPYGNSLFTGRYPEKPAEQLVDDYVSATSGLSHPYSEDDLARFLEQDRAQILSGQAIYPYYLEADQGPINHALPAYKPRPYNRLVIYLSGSVSTNVILPLATPDFTFPDGVDVIVLGCINDVGDIEALSILIRGETPLVYLRVPLPELTCPLPEHQ